MGHGAGRWLTPGAEARYFNRRRAPLTSLTFSVAAAPLSCPQFLASQPFLASSYGPRLPAPTGSSLPAGPTGLRTGRSQQVGISLLGSSWQGLATSCCGRLRFNPKYDFRMPAASPPSLLASCAQEVAADHGCSAGRRRGPGRQRGGQFPDHQRRRPDER